MPLLTTAASGTPARPQEEQRAKLLRETQSFNRWLHLVSGTLVVLEAEFNGARDYESRAISRVVKRWVSGVRFFAVHPSDVFWHCVWTKSVAPYGALNFSGVDPALTPRATVCRAFRRGLANRKFRCRR